MSVFFFNNMSLFFFAVKIMICRPVSLTLLVGHCTIYAGARFRTPIIPLIHLWMEFQATRLHDKNKIK
jgi:poly-beta-hydroxyalkanoate depolymerase